MNDRPAVVLTRHFFSSLFDFGFLSDAGVESLKRALLGCLAGAIAIGLLLTRVFMAKYAALSTAPPDVYERAVVADHAFLIAIPMWIVAAAVGLAGHSLFPDQTDFRVLMAEPLSRLTVFASKLASLLLFVSLFVAGTHVALLPLFSLTMIGAMDSASAGEIGAANWPGEAVDDRVAGKTRAVVATTAAFVFSSVAGSLCAALSVIAVHGALVLFAPRARLIAFSGTVRSVLLGLLVLSMPLIARLPAAAEAFASGAWWLRWTPPAWFAGLERFLIGAIGGSVGGAFGDSFGDSLGNTRYASLAARAAMSTLVVFAVTVTSYVLLYRRFDRVVLQSAASDGGGDGRAARAWRRSLDRWAACRAPVRQAVARFVWLTIRRSVLHQGLVVGLLAAAGGFVLNGLLSVDGWNDVLPASSTMRSPVLVTLLWAPMTMMFLAIPAIRLALSVPVEPRSNWIFRMTEDVAGRTEVAAANVNLVFTLGVALPLALLAPLQWWMLGPSSLGVIVIETVTGWLLVEWRLTDWRRIPFTCSYIPGKGFVPMMFVKGFHAYIFFGVLTTLILGWSLSRPRVAIVIAAVIGGAAAALSLHRRRTAHHAPLVFDDELPTDLNPLRLDLH